MSSRAEEKNRARLAREEAERAESERLSRRRRLITLGCVLAAAALIVVVAVGLSRSGTSKAPAPAQAAALFAGIPSGGPFLGRPDAPVVVEEFADLQCPFCAKAARDVLPTLVRDYVRPGRVRLRFRALAFIGPDSQRAGGAAVAAGLQGHQWPFVERFYARQGAENSGYATDGFIRAIASSVPGLDPGRVLAGRATAAVSKALADDANAARAVGVSSTPTFVVGRRGQAGKAVSSAGLDAVRAAVDPLLK